MRITVGPRDVFSSRRLADGRIEQELDGIEVSPPEVVEGLEVTRVSVGNPHAVVVGDPDDLPRIGPTAPQLETHASFRTGRTCRSSASDAPGRVTARVWERGVGETSASGTSAVAVAAATHDEGEVVVSFPAAS